MRYSLATINLVAEVVGVKIYARMVLKEFYAVNAKKAVKSMTPTI